VFTHARQIVPSPTHAHTCPAGWSEGSSGHAHRHTHPLATSSVTLAIAHTHTHTQAHTHTHTNTHSRARTNQSKTNFNTQAFTRTQTHTQEYAYKNIHTLHVLTIGTRSRWPSTTRSGRKSGATPEPSAAGAPPTTR